MTPQTPSRDDARDDRIRRPPPLLSQLLGVVHPPIGAPLFTEIGPVPGAVSIDQLLTPCS